MVAPLSESHHLRATTTQGEDAVYRTLTKLWSRLTLFAWKIPSIQHQLDVYRAWYNTERPMWHHVGRTPEEVWSDLPKPSAAPIRAHDEQPFVTVRRIDYRGDEELPTLEIKMLRAVQRVA